MKHNLLLNIIKLKVLLLEKYGCRQGRDVWADVRYTPDGTKHTYTLILSLYYFGRWGKKMV